MERWLPTGLAALALLVGAWNAWSLSSLSARIDAAGPAVTDVASASSSGEDSGGKPSRWSASRKPRYEGALPERYAPRPTEGGGGAVTADDPEFREKVASVMEAEEERRDAERRERFEESMRTEVQAFADEEGLDEATTTALLAQMAERSKAFRAVRDDVRDGTISWSDARAEMEELRAANDAELEKLIGPERAERLEERLWGDRGGWGGRP
jgi:hypothetical protein